MMTVSNVHTKNTLWPTSNIKRKYPGIGVSGRVWKNINASNLKLIMGDVLRDSNSIAAIIDIDINIKHKDISFMKIIELNFFSNIEDDTITHEEFNEFINIAKESKKYKLRISFNNKGFFW